MVLFLKFNVLTLVFTFCSVPAFCDSQKQGARLLRGVILTNDVFLAEPGETRQVISLDTGREFAVLASVHLFRTRWREGKEESPVAKFAHEINGAKLGNPVRFRIHNGTYWDCVGAYPEGCLHSIPLGKLSEFAQLYPSEYQKKTDQEQRLLGILDRKHKWNLPLIEGVSKDAVGDLLPVQEDRVLLFMIQEKQLSVRECVLDPKASDPTFRLNFVKIAERPIYSQSINWQDSFSVFGQERNFYFVTDSGKLYLWRNAGKADQEMRCLWEEKANPIRVLMTDSKANKTFAFTAKTAKAKETVKNVFFTLEQPLSAERYELPAVRDNMPQSLKILVAHARFLKSAGKIN